MTPRYLITAGLAAGFCAAAALGGGTCDWTAFTDETSKRLSVAANIGANDPEEKDYAWADIDKDGDDDLVIVRKEPFSSPGPLRNVLLMNENGVLVDRTADFASASDVNGDQGFLTATDDRDVALVDVDGDTWLDIVTAVTYGDGLPKHISHPRVYMNLGNNGGGNWLGFMHEDARIPQLSIPGNFCAVAVGDVTNDGSPDLYFADYLNDLEDILLVNDGNGFFSDATNSAFAGNTAFLTSTFTAHAVIADLNDDGFNDILKVSALGPYELKTAYNNPANPGVFSAGRVDIVCANCSDYFVSVGNLNNDGMLDLIESDDGSDIVFLNQGNGGDGFANFSSVTLPDSGGFNGNSVIADFNNDGFNDLIVTDVDVDIPGCDRDTTIYRNNGNIPNVTFTEDNAGIPEGSRTGGHDAAVFDIDGNGFVDIVLGTCFGTSVWMNNPPASIDFSYPSGLPPIISPETGATIDVQLDPNCQAKISGGEIFVSIEGEPFVSSPLVFLGGNQYQATLPAGTTCGDTVEFYFAATVAGGSDFLDPPSAPQSVYAARSAEGLTTVFEDHIEADVSGWSVVDDPGLTSGSWEQADPNGTVFGGNLAQPEDDATPGARNVQAFITENCQGADCDTPSSTDVDGGPTDLTTPAIDLSSVIDARISFARWYFNNDEGTADGDTLTVSISNNGGASWVDIPELDTTGTGSAWETVSFFVSDYVAPTANVQVRFRAMDEPNNSVAEAGIDDLVVEELTCGGDTCPWDCELVPDGLVSTPDLLAMLGQWFGPGSCEFSGDGMVSTPDLLKLLANWGACPS